MRKRHVRQRGNRDAGFTLMETLVVLTIFSLVVLSATDIFLLANLAQRKVLALGRIQADARFAMESMVREIRTGNIDYQWYEDRGGPPDSPDLVLALVNSAGSKIVFKRSDATDREFCADANSRPCLLVSLDGSPPSPISPPGTRVRRLFFYINPDKDPFAFDATLGDFTSDVQPFVTISLSLETTQGKAAEQSLVYFQTTATSRGYKR